MNIALLADVHANLEALRACLEHARGAGATRLAFLGDLVGYGADPGPVVDMVRAEVERGAAAVLGNHDAAVLAPGAAGSMNDAAARAVEWTRGRLTGDQRAFLAALPLVVRDGPLVLVHASAEQPQDWIYVSGALAAERCLAAAGDATYVLCGHVHQPLLWYTAAGGRALAFRPASGVAIPVPRHRRWIAIPGAVGQPRDGSAAASYAMLDPDRASLTFHRVPYDARGAAAKVRAAGLPESLAARLERGE